MKLSSFAWGLGVGLVAGMVVEMAIPSNPRARNTAAGNVMRRMGSAVDSAVDDVNHMMK
ncbi:MAG: hypothetical protein II458_06125 [Oscillospiraceae bacterium]|nr:hypothetical protein [Oscillospiraceae bacterium]